MLEDKSSLNNKIISLKNIDTLSHIKDKKVLAGGCFDILHYGHLTFLKNAKDEGDVLIILLESDEFIFNTKKRKPIHSQEQRATILSNLTVIDYVIPLPLMNTNDEYFELVKTIRPSVIALTEGDQKLALKKEQADKVGAELKVVTIQLPFSSSTYAPLFRD